jgi:hypothetical protein
MYNVTKYHSPAREKGNCHHSLSKTRRATRKENKLFILLSKLLIIKVEESYKERRAVFYPPIEVPHSFSHVPTATKISTFFLKTSSIKEYIHVKKSSAIS